MSPIAEINQGSIITYGDILNQVNLEGLTKLVVEGEDPTGLYFMTPDMGKVSKEEWKEKCIKEREERERTQSGPYPLDLHLSSVWTPKRLVTQDGETPKITQAYTPIKFFIPIAEEETSEELKERIERESMIMVESVTEEYVRDKSVDREVNAFYVGNLNRENEIVETIKHCVPVKGVFPMFLNEPARNILIPRVAFDLCLFEIENGKE